MKHENENADNLHTELKRRDFMAKNRETALKELDTSLSRMKTDYVDLWQVHALRFPKMLP